MFGAWLPGISMLTRSNNLPRLIPQDDEPTPYFSRGGGGLIINALHNLSHTQSGNIYHKNIENTSIFYIMSYTITHVSQEKSTPNT